MKAIVLIPTLTPVFEQPILRASKTTGYSKTLKHPFDLTSSSKRNLYPNGFKRTELSTRRSIATKPLMESWVSSFYVACAILQKSLLRNWRTGKSLEIPPLTYREPTTTGWVATKLVILLRSFALCEPSPSNTTRTSPFALFAPQSYQGSFYVFNSFGT
jgi:hypothetical protein